jgi:iron complex transport system ATP-binding protein
MKLAAQKVEVRSGGTVLVSDASLSLAAGELVGLIGPNGAGKSTLVRSMAGLLPLAAGTVLLDGRPIGEVPARARARAIAFLPQEGRVHWKLSVRQVVTLGRSPHRGGWRPHEPVDLEAVSRAMQAAGVSELADRDATSLSTGERARVLLARALAVEAGVLLADEPVAALDPYHQIVVLEHLRSLARNGAAVLVVIHDLPMASRFMDRLALMDRGRLVTSGPPVEVLADPRLAEAFGVEMLRGEHQGAAWALPWTRR